MPTNHEHNGQHSGENNDRDEQPAARRTAHALGQTEGAERAAIERELAASPVARQEAAEIEQLAAHLKEAFLGSAAVEPSAALRHAIERRLAELESVPCPTIARAAQPWWRRRLAAMALTAACLVILAVPAAQWFNPSGAMTRDAKDRSHVALLSDAVPLPRIPTLTPTTDSNKKFSVDAYALITDPVQAGAGGQTLPSPWYLHDDVQYSPPASGNSDAIGTEHLLGTLSVTFSGMTLPSRGESGGVVGNVTIGQQQPDSSGAPGIDTGGQGYSGIAGGATGAVHGGYGYGPMASLDYNSAKELGNVDMAGGAIDLTTGALIVTTSSYGFVAQGGRTGGYGDAAIHDALTEGKEPNGWWSQPGQPSSDYATPEYAVPGGNNTFSGALVESNSLSSAYSISNVGYAATGGVQPNSVTFNNNKVLYAPFASGQGIDQGQHTAHGAIGLGGTAENSFTGTVTGKNSITGDLIVSTTSTSYSGTPLPYQGNLQLTDKAPDEPGVVYPDAETWKELMQRRKEKDAARGNGAPSLAGAAGRINPVQIETSPGSNVLVIKGNPADVAAVERIAKQSEQKSVGRSDAKDDGSGKSGGGQNSAAKPAETLAANTEAAKDAAMAKADDKEVPELEKITSRVRTFRQIHDAQVRAVHSAPATTLPVEISRQSMKPGDVVDAASVQRRLKASELYKADPKKSAKPAPQKPLQSWKPAHVVPNASRLMVGDKEELPLKGMQVDVRVDGFRARVLLDLYYENDRPRQLEGNFQLRLPDEATPYFFAFGRTVYQAPQAAASESMFFKPQQVSLGDTTPDKILALRGNSWEQPKVARMVPKEKAAMAYRDTVRRRIDPALVEWSGAGVFQCKVFPLAPHALHRITIGYDVDLTRVGDDLELRLDLPEQAPGAEKTPTIVDVNVAASDARQVSLDAPATQSGGRLAYRLTDPKDRPLVVRLRKPGTVMLAGNDEATGNYFATRVALPLPESGEQGAGSGEQGAGSKGQEGRPAQAVFLVDTSLSAGPQFPLWTKMLRATLENNRGQIKQFAVLFFNVETFWWQEKYVPNTPENVEAAINYADNLALEGATDLGRALHEASAPKWRAAGDEPSPDMFLLSDGAATWGEDRWALLAASLTHGPSPKGKAETSSALFAYRTGLAGGDTRLLTYLAERTGGAVFSLAGEAEVAAASVAYRNRPWKLTNIEMAGAHDVLVAGRPQYVFPGQQLTIVGRLESQAGGTRKLGPPYDAAPVMTFTLQQGITTQTIKVAMDQVLPSELAARTFGQVATNQLEDVAALAPAASSNGRGEEVEPVATAYARHFRITGRTCSLLMLDTEQDYARFNIKPEEDSFVVKERPADPIVAQAIAGAVATMSDPKASFLAWYRRLVESSAVHFDLPASLKVYIDGLPDETFAVVPRPLACKLRLRQDLPENLRQQWKTGLADYDTLDAEARRRLAAYGPDDALRCLSSLVEERPGDPALARDLAFTAIDWQRPGEAYHLLRRAGSARSFEPITFYAMAHCLEQMAYSDHRAADLAIVYYELACGGQWDQRFGDMHNIALLDYARFLRRVVAGELKSALPGYAESRLATLRTMNLRDTADVAAILFWNTDGTDVDLHVIEPSGEECFYQHTETVSGGHISRDVTTGYGPELYLLPKAPAGKYAISAHYFATDANRATTRTKVLAFIYENWGTKDERVVVKSLALTGRSERQDLGEIKR